MLNRALVALLLICALNPSNFASANTQLQLSGCSQSSTFESDSCGKALDGNTNQHRNSGHSCSHTNEDTGAWWAASTNALAHFAEVKIFNRADCCQERLNNFVILVDGQYCASYNSNTTFSVQSFACNKYGRELKIVSQKRTYLTLCEVQAFGQIISAPSTQLPLSGCSQSSNYFFDYCEKAIDGNTDQQSGSGYSCSQTNLNPGAWWAARTKRSAYFAEVKIFNRADCCPERLNNFTILVDGHQCASYNSNTPFSVKSFACGRVGRELKIVSQISTYLTLCEVQLFGQILPLTQLQLSGCSQSSNYFSDYCGKAIDGNTNQNSNSAKSCSHTNEDTGAWWAASTNALAYFAEVKIFNRADCCPERLNNFVILVDGQQCASYNSGSSFSIQSFDCNKYGRELKIVSQKRTYLTLCEVQAFGEIISAPITQLPLSECSQSSTYTYNYLYGYCGKAIDRRTDQHMGSGNSCSMTDLNSGAWWSARTNGTAHFAEVKIFNRADCCSERLNNFVIQVDGHQCASYNSNTAFSIHSFACGRVGQELKIVSQISTYLTLCEVQVFGQILEN